MGIAKDKGNALEQAVHFIEETILKSNPKLKNEAFEIEPKKIIRVEGVRHEIDLHVEINIGNRYKAIFIFECKNWEDKVNKNEIIVLSEKMEVCKAQQGFIIAKHFTKDAYAQAKKDGGIELLIASSETELLSKMPIIEHYLTTDFNKRDVKVQFIYGDNPSSHKSQKLDLQKVKAQLNSKEILLAEYLSNLINKVASDAICIKRTELGIGTHVIDFEDILLCNNDLLEINELRIEKISIKGTIPVTKGKYKLISKFDVSSRGRIMTYSEHSIEGYGKVQPSIIQTNNDYTN